tara:strand:+ start:375 stop:1181 length:807 start_codon:yes stop_codon:yes gene_type:complete
MKNKSISKFIIHSVLFISLTVITQVGGLLYVLSILARIKLKLPSRWLRAVLFFSIYSVFTFFIIPPLAKQFGRERIKNNEAIRPTTYFTVFLNRNYVNTEMNELILESAKTLKGSGIKINYLDANFPFLNNFPLLPHLSHDDGKKLDISFVYVEENGTVSNSKISFFGYGFFEKAKTGEFDQTAACKQKGYNQYDLSKFLSFGARNKKLSFSPEKTKILVNTLLKNDELEKLFIEPHLKIRMNLSSDKVRFHGCQAVRHDDHIHIEIK